MICTYTQHNIFIAFTGETWAGRRARVGATTEDTSAGTETETGTARGGGLEPGPDRGLQSAADAHRSKGGGHRRHADAAHVPSPQGRAPHSSNHQKPSESAP